MYDHITCVFTEENITDCYQFVEQSGVSEVDKWSRYDPGYDIKRHTYCEWEVVLSSIYYDRRTTPALSIASVLRSHVEQQ